MQIFTESSSDLWKKFSAPEFSFQKTFIYPTETFYALGCRADCNDAIEKIYRLKKREKNKPLLVLVDSWQMLNKYADIKDINSEAIERLLKIIGNGNCTIVLPTRNSLSQLNFKEKNFTVCSPLQVNSLSKDKVCKESNFRFENSFKSAMASSRLYFSPSLIF